MTNIVFQKLSKSSAVDTYEENKKVSHTQNRMSYLRKELYHHGDFCLVDDRGLKEDSKSNHQRLNTLGEVRKLNEKLKEDELESRLKKITQTRKEIICLKNHILRLSRPGLCFSPTTLQMYEEMLLGRISLLDSLAVKH